MTQQIQGTYEGIAYEDIGVTLLHRFAAISGSGSASPVTKEGNLIKQADVSSISVKVFDADGAQISTTLTPSASSVIFDTLQTSGTWGNISRGGNFRYTIPGTYFPSGNTTNRAQILVTLTDGTVLVAVWKLTVNELLGQ